MHYIYYFDIAAIFVEILVIVFFNFKKFLPTNQNKIFFIFVVVLLTVTILDAVTSFDVEYGGLFPRWLTYVLNALYLSGTTSFGLIFIWYTLNLSDFLDDNSKTKNSIVSVALFLPYIVIALLIWASFLFPNPQNAVFYLDENNAYHRGTFLFYLLYAESALYLLGILVFVFLYRKKISRTNIVLILLYSFTIIISVAIQFFFPYLLVECFGIALTCVTFLFFIQRPEEVLDSVTGLFNVTAFIRMHKNLSKADSRFSMISVSLNDIPFLINTFGIKTLNKILQLMADFLRKNFSFFNIYCIGQGEFCIVVKENSDGSSQNSDDALRIVSQRLKGTWEIDEIKLKLYSQICVIKYPENAKTAEEYFDIVNTARFDDRYNRPIVYANEIDLEHRHETAKIEYAVRKGLSENRYMVYYQPIYSAADKRVIGGEALIRLKDDNGNFISPEIFIPIAEKNGTVLRIGEFVFETVCRNLSKIDLEEAGIKKIDINLSVAQCMQEILADQLVTIKTIYQIPTEILNLEITESALAHTPEIMMKNIQRLVDSGFEFSLDDYGSGYSNLNYMLNMPFSMIKIDKYIVWAALKDPRAEIALSATIKMIKSLGMTVLAEGVENREQMDWLIGLGCDYLQGFYYSKPCPIDDFLPLLKIDY